MLMSLVRAGTARDEMAIMTGTEVGALLVDGLGDGLLIECPGEDVGQLRLMSFGLLQVGPLATALQAYLPALHWH